MKTHTWHFKELDHTKQLSQYECITCGIKVTAEYYENVRSLNSRSDIDDCLSELDPPKMYIAVREEVPAHMVPVLVAHTVLNADQHFQNQAGYSEWKRYSFRKVVVKVNRKEFTKLLDLNCFLGYETTVLDAQVSCAVIFPCKKDQTPNVLKYAKLWNP